MDFPLYFQKVMLLWQGSIVEIDYGFFRVFGLEDSPSAACRGGGRGTGKGRRQ